MESNPEIQRLEALKVQFVEGLESYVEIIQNDQYAGEKFDIDPFTMGFDEDIIDDLPEWEQGAIEEELYGFLGIPKNPEMVENYMTSGEEQEESLAVSILATDKEGVFIHEIIFPDGTKRWVLGDREKI